MPLIPLEKNYLCPVYLRLTYPNDPIPRMPESSGNVHVGNLGENIMSYKFYLRLQNTLFSLNPPSAM